MTSPARLDFLDGLRALAALGVVGHHYIVAFYPAALDGTPTTAHLPGHWEAWLAALPMLHNFRVSFFFVLSGLVLAASVARTPSGWRSLLPQLVRRYVRLGTPLAVSVALAYGLLLTHCFYNRQAGAASGAAWLAELWRWMPTFRQFVGDALFGVLIRGEMLYSGSFWTMPIEWRGSVLVLTTVALVGGHAWRLAAYGAVAVGCLLLPVNSFYLAFVLGLSLHDVYRRQWHGRLATRARWVLTTGLVVVSIFLANYPQTDYQVLVASPLYAWRPAQPDPGRLDADFYHTVGAAALLAAVLLSARLQAVVAIPTLRRIGKRAFSLYLLHFLLLGSASSWLFVWLRGHWAYHTSFGLMAFASGVVLVVLAEGFYRVVDVPSHAIARWVGRVVAAGLARLPTVRTR